MDEGRLDTFLRRTSLSQVIDRFEQKFIPEPNSGCWLWLASVGAGGYGWVKDSGRARRAHRVSYERYVEPIPAGLCVLHRCDIPCCVNPAHLFLGTQADNMADMEAKGRGRSARGEAASAAKLKQNDVLAIRAAVGKTQRQLSKEHGVSRRQIGLILRRKSWTHVPEKPLIGERYG